jgi:hypothetical protein
MNNDINKELLMPEGTLKKFRTESQVSTINEAILFSKSFENKGCWTCIYKLREYEVGVYKPGKEYYENYYRDDIDKRNINDMKPTIRKNGHDLDTIKSFTEIFEALEVLMKENNIELLRILGAIFFRNSFMLDHVRNEEKKFRYIIPENSRKYLMDHKPLIVENLPTDVFLYFLDVIGLNEDTKYFTLPNYDVSNGTGRGNNFSTYANLMAVFMQKQKLSKFAGSLSRPPTGIATLSQKAARDFFKI